MSDDYQRPTLTLDSELRYLKGVGPRGAGQLRGLGLTRVADLLFHLPLRYEDRTRLTPPGRLRVGEPAQLRVRVDAADLRFGRRRSLVVAVDADGRALQLRLFHFNAAQQAAFKPGAWLQVYGTVRMGTQGLEFVHPEYRVLAGPDAVSLETALTPVYPTVSGLGQARLRRLVGQALTLLRAQGLAVLLPPQPGLPALQQALLTLHAPPPDSLRDGLLEGGHPARQRLALEELLAQQLAARARRHALREQSTRMLNGDGRLRRAFHAALPFHLTAAQQRVIAEVAADLARPRPMLRLVQGDVGSGKTVIAADAVLTAIEAGTQAALMAPTELLAEQHYRVLHAWLTPLGVNVQLLSAGHKPTERRAVAAAIADGSCQLAVGTHILFQKDVTFADLGLCVVDEQHRFGVQQRLALRDKGAQAQQPPHQLVLTATPIPRTLAMCLYADLDVSVLDELPPGRQPITTLALPDSRRAEVVTRVAAACRRGEQVYWVCTLVEESEQLDAEAAEATAAALREQLPDLNIGLVHGRLRGADKDAEMARFRAGELQLLVATTVIEVGVDVPNASVMIIDNAERLGLAQLHQLRGRVGRGSRASYCLLIYSPPLSQLARERLKVMRESSDGFAIAERDLALRGPGELLGTKQSGMAALKIADLARDAALLPRAQQLADELLDTQPEQAQALVRRWLGPVDMYANA